MFPDDPNGMRFWLEPIVWLTVHFTLLRISKSLIVYSVPNCLQRKSTDSVLVRYAKWESGFDKDQCQKGTRKHPSTTTAYKILSSAETALVDNLVRKLDESLASFPFPLEGLDLYGPSGFKPLPEDAVIVTDATQNELCRTTRFSYMEIHWSPIQDKLSVFDQAWLTLFETLSGLTENSSSPDNAETVEKYEIHPLDYGKGFDAECL
jgi:hypothetical protein